MHCSMSSRMFAKECLLRARSCAAVTLKHLHDAQTVLRRGQRSSHHSHQGNHAQHKLHMGVKGRLAEHTQYEKQKTRRAYAALLMSSSSCRCLFMTSGSAMPPSSSE